MKKNQLRTYCPPKSTLIYVETLSLMEGSFPGQHNPAQPGGTISSAKQGFVWEDSEDEGSEENYSLWED